MNTRPMIDFSGPSRATARKYAANHISRINQPETNAILSVIAAAGSPNSSGSEVDAYDLAEALLDAMRGAATRAGQSPLRRIHAREIAYLGHIVHAVLANHADNLPAYPAGERSQKIRALEGEVALAEENYAGLSDDFRQAKADRDSARRSEEEAWAEVVRIQKVLDYTRSIVTDQARQRSIGFDDGTRA